MQVPQIMQAMREPSTRQLNGSLFSHDANTAFAINIVVPQGDSSVGDANIKAVLSAMQLPTYKATPFFRRGCWRFVRLSFSGFLNSLFILNRCKLAPSAIEATSGYIYREADKRRDPLLLKANRIVRFKLNCEIGDFPFQSTTTPNGYHFFDAILKKV